MENVFQEVYKPGLVHKAGHEDNLTIKYLLPSLFLTLLLITTSCLNYFKVREIFWAAELPPYLFCAIVCAFALFITGCKKGTVRVGPCDVAVLAFFLYSIASAYIIASPLLPVDRIYELLGGLLFYIAIRLAISPKGMTTTLYGMFFVVLFQAVWGLLQYSSLLPAFAGRPGIQGGLINPGIYGCLMGIGTLLGVYLFSRYDGPKTRRAALGLANLVIVTALAFSLSRTACLAAFCEIGCLLFLCAERKQFIRFQSFRYILFPLIAVCFIGAAVYLWQRDTASVSGRLLIWKISSRMFIEQPLWGMGYGNYFTQYGNYQADYFQSGKGTPKEILTAGSNYYAFNELLKIAIENGLVGLGLFSSIMVITFTGAWQQIREKHLNASIFTLLLVSILVFSLFSYPFQSTTIVCIFYLCIAAFSSAEKPLFSFGFTRTFQTFLFVTAGLLLLQCTHKINALLSWRKAENNLVYAEGDALRAYQKVDSELNNNGAFLFNYGAELAEMGLYSKSREVLIRAQRYLNCVELSTCLAEANERLHDEKQTENYFLHAAYIDPKRFGPFNNLFMFYRRTGQTSKAQILAREILHKQVKIPSIKITEIKDAARQYLLELNPVAKKIPNSKSTLINDANGGVFN